MTASSIHFARFSPRRVRRFAGALCAFVWLSMACKRERPTAPRPAPPALYQIQGKVFKADETDHSGINVYCAGTSFQANSDAAGNYTISGVPPGKYRVRCMAHEFLPAVIGEVSLAAGFADPAVPVVLSDVTLERELSPVEQADRVLCSVMGQALLKDNPDPEGIIVRVLDSDFRTVTAADGNYQLLRLDPGSYTLVFEKEGYVSQRRTFDLVTGDLVFPDAIILEPIVGPEELRTLTGSVTLLDADDQVLEDYAGVLVYIEGSTLVALPSPEGLFRFENLLPQTYTVTAMAPGFYTRDRVEADLTEMAQASVSLTLKSLENPTSAPGSLVGRVLKDDPRDPLVGTLIGLVELGVTVMTDPGGTYVFRNLPPGTYNLVAQADGYNPAALEQVVVPEGEQAEATDLTLEKQRDYPRVLFSSPAGGERAIVVSDIVPVTVRFSKKMRPESLHAAFSIRPPVSYRLFAAREHALSDFDEVYVELPGFGVPEPLRFDTEYTVTLSTAAEDFEGLSLEEPFRLKFRTGRASVIGTVPADGANGVFVDPALFQVQVLFNAPLDPQTVTAEKIRIRPQVGVVPQLSVVNRPGSGWTRVNISATWQQGNRYTVTISSGIRTINNSRISNLPYRFSFTTGRGQTIDFSPVPRRPVR